MANGTNGNAQTLKILMWVLPLAVTAIVAFVTVSVRLDDHIGEPDVHMSLDKKLATFPTRVELDVRLQDIDHRLDRIENKLDAALE